MLQSTTRQHKNTLHVSWITHTGRKNVHRSDRTVYEHTAAYKRAHLILKKRGMIPKLLKLDNESSNLLIDYITDENMDYQYVTVHIHRQNSAERAIRAFKNHLSPVWHHAT